MAGIIFNVGDNRKTRNERGFKYKDLSMPIKRDTNNYDLRSNIDVDAIRGAFKNIFDWNPGERILNPAFGNPILEFMYEPINNDTARRLSRAINTAIESWEPRVEVLNTRITPEEDRNEYYIEIEYQIKAIDLDPITYPMVLSR